MFDNRPSPDELLVRTRIESAGARRGALKIFFGYAAGVGKTYAMLENAQHAKAAGRDVVVGYVEPHRRPDTEALLRDLEAIPHREIEYRGVMLREFDVDAALARKSELILVDELAHTNAFGGRHQKRWQDIEELLDAGIDVWTTLNVQHIESLNDVIGQIMGISVRETVPDRILDLATDLELVDITPEELLHRLSAGKVYLPEQAQRAVQGFFQKSNLNALRELSLRQTAQRVHTDVETARRQISAVRPWATTDRLLVCVGPSPTTARVIRTAKRLAVALDAPWLALSIDLTGESAANGAVRRQIADHFRLAERLGAETVTLAGQSVTGTILDFARSRNVTKILIGKTRQPRWRRMIFGTVVDELLEQSGDIDVYVIQGEEERKAPTTALPIAAIKWSVYLKAAGVTGIAAAVAYGLRSSHIADAEANTVMLFLAGVAGVAYRYGRGPAIFASVFSTLILDFYFVPPLYTFAVSDAQYLVTLCVMLTIGLVISTLTSRLWAQVESTRNRERRTAALYELGKQLSSLYGDIFLAGAAAAKIGEITSGEVAVYLQGPNAVTPEIACGANSTIAKDSVSLPAASWVIQHMQLAGAGTNTLPNAAALFLPIIGSQRAYGALAVRVQDPPRLLEPDERRLLESCANQLALALERDQSAIDAAEARVAAEAEQVRSSLLSSVSHDLKTPLAAIAGASSSLLEASSLDEATRRQLLEGVSHEALRLNRLLENILQMSKLDAGAAVPSKQWHVLEDIVGSALHRVAGELVDHKVRTNLPHELPLIFVDGLLLEQTLVNLLENAARYTPEGSEVTISAAVDGRYLRLAVGDNGPGIPAGAESRIFDKFYRASPAADAGRGSGLGLAICRAVVQAHGGEIVARNQARRGAEFVIRLPLQTDAPQIRTE